MPKAVASRNPAQPANGNRRKKTVAPAPISIEVQEQVRSVITNVVVPALVERYVQQMCLRPKETRG